MTILCKRCNRPIGTVTIKVTNHFTKKSYTCCLTCFHELENYGVTHYFPMRGPGGA